jgi:integrase
MNGIELSDRLVEALRNLPRTHPWVFPTSRGKRHAHVYKIVERVADRARIKNAHPHKFRSTFLTRLLQSGCDIANVQALAGHKSIKTTQRYWASPPNSGVRRSIACISRRRIRPRNDFASNPRRKPKSSSKK